MRLSAKQKAAHKRKISSSRSRSRSYSKGRTYNRPIKKVKLNIPARLGRMAGGYVGNKVHNLISSITGSGDYKISAFPVKSNTLVGIEPGNSPPKFNNSKSGEVRVQHREFIKDIFSGPTAGTALNVETFPIQPGVLTTFPWFSSVAGNFECYRIKGMLFEFKSMSANALNSTNTALGTVIMATQYNAAAPAFSTKQQMENYEYAQSAKPSESMCHYIECAKGSSPLEELYIRTGSIPGNGIQSIQLYDIGNFFIATQGMQATNINLGELWVSYDIELIKPKLTEGAVGGDILWNTYKFDGASYSSTTGVYFPSPVGNDLNNINGVTITNNNISFANGSLPGSEFLILIDARANGLGTTPVVPTITANFGSFVNIFNEGTSGVHRSIGPTTTMSIMMAIKLTSQGNASFTLANSVTIVGDVDISMTISQINNALDNA